MSVESWLATIRQQRLTFFQPDSGASLNLLAYQKGVPFRTADLIWPGKSIFNVRQR